MKERSRKEKIALLKALQNGKATLDDLIQESEAIWSYAAGLYYLGFEGNGLTQTEFEQYTQSRLKQRNIVFKLADGYAVESS